MSKAVAINGSPRREKGNTARILTSFLEGLKEGGCDADLFYASGMDIKTCSCGKMYCWRDAPGECCFKDDMEILYPKLRAADILILATPVYVPLPGEMVNILNRLCPLLDPVLEFRHGRTRAGFREGVNIKQIVLVCTGGWWELENLDLVVRVVEEFAAVASVEFTGAVLRPHAHIMMENGNLTRDGEEILNAAQRAGQELIEEGEMNRETLDKISRPLISREDLWRRYQRAS